MSTFFLAKAWVVGRLGHYRVMVLVWRDQGHTIDWGPKGHGKMGHWHRCIVMVMFMSRARLSVLLLIRHSGWWEGNGGRLHDVAIYALDT